MDPLLETAYALQISYDPENPDYMYIQDQLETLKIYSVTKDWSLWEQEIRDHNNRNRSVPCQESVTFLLRKDIDLMSEAQLIYLPAKKPGFFYPLDAVTDVDALLKLKNHPFTNERLTTDELSFLEQSKRNHKYPWLEVGNFFEEVQSRLCDAPIYIEKKFQKKMREFAALLEDVGLKYEADLVYTFGTDLNKESYNLFLKHQPLNQVIKDGDRDTASAITLNHILNYIALQKQRSVEHGKLATIYLGKAMDEFLYMIRNSLSYADLIKERGIANELNWKPNFVKETYHINGTLHSQYFMDEQGRKHGTYTVYYANGTLGSQGIYENGTRTDVRYYYGNGKLALHKCEAWYPNGNILFDGFTGFDETGDSLGPVMMVISSGGMSESKDNQIVFNVDQGLITQLFLVQNNQYHGFFTSWSWDGELHEIGSYDRNQKTGIWTLYGYNSTIECGCYENNLKIGLWRIYVKGILRDEVFFDTIGRRAGLYQEWNGKGDLILEGYFLNNRKTGLWRSWYDNGQLEKYEMYEDHFRNGLTYEWYRDGTLKSEICYEYNNELGICSRYNSDGSLKHQYFAYDGKREGLYQCWDSDKLIETGLYLNGDRHGYWVFYDRSGCYLNGNQHGIWREMRKGILFIERTFENDRERGLYTKYYPNGQIYLTGIYYDGQPKGCWKYYYPNGQLAGSGNYDYTKPYFSCWDPQGTYIGERFIDRSVGIRFLRPSGGYDGLHTTNQDGTMIVTYYREGKDAGPCIKWTWSESGCHYEES